MANDSVAHTPLAHSDGHVQHHVFVLLSCGLKTCNMNNIFIAQSFRRRERAQGHKGPDELCVSADLRPPMGFTPRMSMSIRVQEMIHYHFTGTTHSYKSICKMVFSLLKLECFYSSF